MDISFPNANTSPLVSVKQLSTVLDLATSLQIY